MKYMPLLMPLPHQNRTADTDITSEGNLPYTRQARVQEETRPEVLATEAT